MFIPPHNLARKKEDAMSPDEIVMKAMHLHLGAHVVEQVLRGETNVQVIYYPKEKKILLAGDSNNIFKSLHKSQRYMLKSKSNTGTKSVAIHDLLIDNDLGTVEQRLEYVLESKIGFVAIHL